MAYGNNFYPMYPTQTNAYPTQMSVAPTQNNNGGFVPVRNEAEARNYPVAYGNSITFKDENAPYIYVKTMGFSQLDRPMFEKFKLVREADAPVASSEPHTDNTDAKAINTTIDEVKAEIGRIWSEIQVIKTANTNTNEVKANE